MSHHGSDASGTAEGDEHGGVDGVGAQVRDGDGHAVPGVRIRPRGVDAEPPGGVAARVAARLTACASPTSSTATSSAGRCENRPSERS